MKEEQVREHGSCGVCNTSKWLAPEWKHQASRTYRRCALTQKCSLHAHAMSVSCAEGPPQGTRVSTTPSTHTQEHAWPDTPKTHKHTHGVAVAGVADAEVCEGSANVFAAVHTNHLR